MPTYSYAKKGGGLGTLESSSPETALASLTKMSDVEAGSGVQATPVGILSSNAGKGIVNTKITPAIQAGQQAQQQAQQNQQTNQQANDAQAQADQANATPPDIQDPLQARLEANQQAQREALRQDQQLYRELSIANTEATASAVRQLQGAWATVQRQQQETNRSAEANITTAGLRAGTARYAPTINEGMIAAQKSYGLQKLQEIDTKYTEAINSANAELARNNLLAAQASAKASQDYLKQAAQEIQDQITNAQEIAKQNAKDKIDAQKEINKIVLEAAKGGATAEQLAMMGSAPDVASAVVLAGNTLQTGEYADYVRASRMSGVAPVDAGTYYQRKIYGDSKGTGLTGDIPFEATINSAASYSGSVTGEAVANKQLAELAQAGDYPALLNRMESLARKGMGADQGKEVFIAQNQIKALDDMSRVLKQYKALGGNMNFLKGKEDQIATRIGTLATDPKFKSIGTQLTAAYQVYRQNMTGAAFGAKENAEYKSVFPSSDKSFQLNDAIIDGLKNYYTENVNNAYDTQLGSGYLNLKDYVEKGLTPTGKYLLETEDKAKQKLIEMSSDPEVWNKVQQFKTDYPDATPYDVLEFLGVPVATSNEVSMSGNRPQRNNNPFNIKASSFTLKYPGVTGKDPIPAEDGGQFLTFATPEDGFTAAKKLITSGSYLNLSVDQALKRWSNRGYGGELVPNLSGKKISQLTPLELNTLMQAMASREGYYA